MIDCCIHTYEVPGSGGRAPKTHELARQAGRANAAAATPQPHVHFSQVGKPIPKIAITRLLQSGSTETPPVCLRAGPQSHRHLPRIVRRLRSWRSQATPQARLAARRQTWPRRAHRPMVRALVPLFPLDVHLSRSVALHRAAAEEIVDAVYLDTAADYGTAAH